MLLTKRNEKFEALLQVFYCVIAISPVTTLGIANILFHFLLREKGNMLQTKIMYTLSSKEVVLVIKYEL